MSAKASRRPQRRGPTVPRGVVVGVAVAVVAAAWAFSARDGSDRSSGTASPAAPDDSGVAHVHGLGINPSDGSLIVATHFGAFRIPAGGDEAARIGASFQDTMGFTVAGPGHFLGSGHPDPAGVQQGQPTRLGLIESTDAGVSWKSLSLGGEVDFHGLAFAHDQVYGWDSSTGRFMVSSDRRAWTTRSTLNLFAFAVDPDDADHLIGTSAAGLVESNDGGRAWESAEGPKLVVLSWDAAAGAWGADPTGATWHRAGSAWERAGLLPGQPQAFLATPDVLYAAALDGDVTGIYRSSDQGRTWQLRYRDK